MTNSFLIRTGRYFLFITSVSAFLLLSSTGFAQEKNTLSGYVYEKESGETLIGANVYIPAMQKGTTTNAYGFYSLTLQPDIYEIQFSYLGFQTLSREVDLTEGDVELNVEIGSEAEELEEVIITGEIEDRNISELQMSVERLDMKTVERLPNLLGEVDVIRSILLLPGVTGEPMTQWLPANR